MVGDENFALRRMLDIPPAPVLTCLSEPARHGRFVAEGNLTLNDQGVSEHQAACKIIQYAL